MDRNDQEKNNDVFSRVIVKFSRVVKLYDVIFTGRLHDGSQCKK